MEMRDGTSLGEHTIRSHRWNRPADLRIDFEMLTLPPEIAVMDGSWTVEPVGGKAKLVLVHNFRPAPDNGIPLPELSAMLHQTHERVVGEYKKWLEAARGDEPGDAYGRRTAANTIPAGTFENCELFFARLQQAGLTWGDITHTLKDLKKESTLEDWADWHRRWRAVGDGYERRATEAFEAGHLGTGRHSIRNAAASPPCAESMHFDEPATKRATRARVTALFERGMPYLRETVRPLRIPHEGLD